MQSLLLNMVAEVHVSRIWLEQKHYAYSNAWPQKTIPALLLKICSSLPACGLSAHVEIYAARQSFLSGA